jgi:hypothetical protein
MSWLAVLLVGFGVTDLTHSVVGPRPRVRVLPEGVGALAALMLGLFAGLTGPRDVLALVVIVGVVLLWGHLVTRGFGRGPAWAPLLLILASVGAAILCSGLASPSGGDVGRWLDSVTFPVLAGIEPDRFLLLLGCVLVQLSTGNVVVRLVLKATGTINPGKDGSLPATPLKGGRLLGPLERVFILALGIAGEVTAASIVIAAKGLLRFPELSSKPDQARVHQITEYFLLGSFVSWTVSLSCLVLLAGGAG